MMEKNGFVQLRHGAAKALFIVLVGGALAFLPAARGEAQVQATKHEILRWLNGVCIDILSDEGRRIIAERNKTVAEVCRCFAKDMWRRYPTIYFWVQETTPYEWNQVTSKFPEALATCVFD